MAMLLGLAVGGSRGHCDFSHFVLRQVTRRVGRPEVAMHLHGAHTEAAAADVEEAAPRAFAFEPASAVAQRSEGFVARVAPDFAEGPLFHVAERESLPELVGMNVALC